MKTCPVCRARCFDDMEVCYGCLHRFNERGTICEDDPANDIAEPALPPEGASRPRGGRCEGPSEPVRMREPERACRPAGEDENENEDEDGREDGESFERVTATVRPSRGLHGSMVVRIEIPAWMFRLSSGEAGTGAFVELRPESARRREAGGARQTTF